MAIPSKRDMPLGGDDTTHFILTERSMDARYNVLMARYRIRAYIGSVSSRHFLTTYKKGHAMPTVTVWLTSYNHASYLQYSIDSILNQTYQDFELYIIDDCSSDDSWRIITRYEEEHENVHGIRNKQNTNECNCFLPVYIDRAAGRYLAIAHSDDAWAPTKLEKQVEYLEAHQEILACFTWAQLIDDHNHAFENKAHFYHDAFKVSNRSRFEWLHYFFFVGCPLCHPSLLIRKEAYEKDGLYAKALNSVPDFYKWIHICLHDDIHIIEEPLTFFRVHADESNTSGNNLSNRFRTAVEDYLILREFEGFEDSSSFLSAFPEALRYVDDDDVLIPYALARVALEHGDWKMHKLYGLERLYGLLKNEETASILEKKYHYTEREFNRDKQRFDIFGVVPESATIDCGLYIDFGKGFNDSDCFRQQVYLSEDDFTVEWNLPEICGGRTPVAFRFDPDERSYRKYRIVSLDNAGGDPSAKAVNAAKVEDGWDIFFTMDPEYLLSDVNDRRRLSLSVRTALLTRDEVAGFADALSTLGNELSSTRNELVSTEGRLVSARNELASIKTSRSWKLAQRLSDLHKQFRHHG